MTTSNAAGAKPISRREDALAVVRTLAAAGHVAYFAGGCVRDQLCGRDPSDFDVATSATPDAVRQLLPRSQGVGQAFGVVLARVGPSQIEVATFRADGHYSDGRRPDDVRFATEFEDAQRRDFTINGLFYDPLHDRVIDHVGGRDDLEAGVIRAIGDASTRFAEDFLRMLRAVRFAARFSFAIESATADAIRANAHKLARIAPERIAGELRSMLTASTRVAALDLLDTLGLTPIIFRRSIFPADAAASSAYVAALPVDASFATVLSAVAIARAGGPRVALAGSAARAIEAEFRRTLKLSNDELLTVRTALGLGSLLLAESMPSVATMKRSLAQRSSDDARDLLSALRDDPSIADRADAVQRAFDSFPIDAISPPPFVTGEDLQALGHAPGPAFKVALDAAYDAQLEGTVTSRDAALAIARDRMG